MRETVKPHHRRAYIWDGKSLWPLFSLPQLQMSREKRSPWILLYLISELELEDSEMIKKLTQMGG